MSSGYLFRKFRELRGLTQKALGKKVNLDDVRIRQYELDIRSPKEDVFNNISSALGVKPEYFKDPSYPYDFEEVIRLLFKLEDSIPIGISKVDIDGTPVHSLVFLGHNILKIDKTLEAWTQMQFKFMDEEISWEEYEDWKANWPDSLREDYEFNPEGSKNTSYKEYMAQVQKLDDIQATKESLAERKFRVAKNKIENEEDK